MPHPYISIIIPAYNEDSRIIKTLTSVTEYLEAQEYSSEIILVNDGSSDATSDAIKKFQKKFSNMQLFINPKNRGKGYSVKRGVLEAKGEYVLFMDADNSVDISHLDVFLPQAQKGSDVVIGSIHIHEARAREHAGWYRRVLGSCANILVQLLAVPGIQDTQRGFKLFSKTAAQTIFPLQTIERFGFDIEILVIARLYGFSIVELPVHWDNPAGSKVTARAYMQTLVELLRILKNRLMQKYVKKSSKSVLSPTYL